jgi:hypothetical protein
MNLKQAPVRGGNQRLPKTGSVSWTPVFIAFAIVLIAAPVSAVAVSNVSVQPAITKPDIVQIGIYVVDFSRVDIGTGAVGVDFYLNLKSDKPVSINDLELMNEVITTVTTVNDAPREKVYRIIAVLTAEPDLSRYPLCDQCSGPGKMAGTASGNRMTLHKLSRTPVL